MKKLLLISLIVFLFSCDQPVDLIDETIIEEEATENFVPIITLNQESQIIENGSSLTLSVEIDDQDDFYHYYVWTINDVIVSDEETYTFSKTPEIQTDYLLGIMVTDGKGIVHESITITVLEPPWAPEPLHIYFFEIGIEPDEDLWIKDYIAEDNTQYQYFLSTIATSLQTYNRDNDPDCYLVYGGYE